MSYCLLTRREPYGLNGHGSSFMEPHGNDTSSYGWTWARIEDDSNMRKWGTYDKIKHRLKYEKALPSTIWIT